MPNISVNIKNSWQSRLTYLQWNIKAWALRAAAKGPQTGVSFNIFGHKTLH